MNNDNTPRLWRSIITSVLAMPLVLGCLAAHAGDPDLLLTVGPDPECDHLSLENAWRTVPPSDAFREVEIRVRRDHRRSTHLVIDDLAARPEGFHLTIAGGYTACTDDTPLTSRSELMGNNQSPIVEISAGGPGNGPALDRTVEFVGIEFEDNDLSAIAQSRGGAIYATAGRVLLRDTRIVNTAAREGGGVYLGVDPHGSRPSLVLRGFVLLGGEATSTDPGVPVAGGTIACLSDPSHGRIEIDAEGAWSGTSRAIATSAIGGGLRGGLAALDHCTMRMVGPGFLRTFLLASGLGGAFGGTIWAANGSQVNLADVRLDPSAQSRSGVTFGNGGAFYVDSGSILRLSGVLVRGAELRGTTSRGGVLSANGDGTTVEIGCAEHTGGNLCRPGSAAPVLFEVTTISRAESGGAILATDGARIRASGLVIDSARANRGAAVEVVGESSAVTLRNSQILRSAGVNGATAESLFHVDGGALHLEHVTTAENDNLAALIDSSSDALVTVNSSLLAEDSAVSVMGQPGIDVITDGCVLTSAASPYPATAGAWDLLPSPADMGFDAESPYQYRLAQSSLAVDRCAGPATLPTDIEGDPRDSTAGMPASPDPGADERVGRVSYCQVENTVLNAASHTFVMDVPSDEVIRDLDVEMVLQGNAIYRASLATGSFKADLHFVNGDRAGPNHWYIDDEAIGRSNADIIAVRPDAFDGIADRLGQFDGRPLNLQSWVLTLDKHSDGTPSALDQWCLTVPPPEQVFGDSFE
ncbi:MAG: hypothetical protein QNJ40_03835 [Xanthomonadales bacterium]|nr:hypothetical protein [Xanthomonadales bacterium]